MARQSHPHLGTILTISVLAAGATSLVTPALAQDDSLDGAWVLENEGSNCDDPFFRIADGTLAFSGGDAWPINSDGLLLTVSPPDDCAECESAPFDIMPDGSLQRFVEGTVERFVNCDAPPVQDVALDFDDRVPGQEAATDAWEQRAPDDGAEAYFSTGRTTMVVGCRRAPATVFVRYYPRGRYQFPEVQTPRGSVNILIGTEHPQFGEYFSAHDFASGTADARVYYEGSWAASDPFFIREEAFRLIASFRTGTQVMVQSPTVVAGTPDRQYEDVFTLEGSSAAIDGAMQAGGCAGFLAATEEAIRTGRYQ